MAKFKNGRQRLSQIPNPPKPEGVFVANHKNGKKVERIVHMDGVERIYINGARVSHQEFAARMFAVQAAAFLPEQSCTAGCKALYHYGAKPCWEHYAQAYALAALVAPIHL